MEKLEKKRKYSEIYVRCDCGYICHKHHLKRHRDGNEHLKLLSQMRKMENCKVKQCFCGCKYLNFDEGHLTSRIHKENVGKLEEMKQRKTYL